jgi:hypothetical protein
VISGDTRGGNHTYRQSRPEIAAEILGIAVKNPEGLAHMIAIMRAKAKR